MGLHRPTSVKHGEIKPSFSSFRFTIFTNVKVGITIALALFYLKQDVSETRLCLRLQKKRMQVSPVDRDTLSPDSETETSLFHWIHLSRFHLKSETESSVRNVEF
jgi:hypothetical protein